MANKLTFIDEQLSRSLGLSQSGKAAVWTPKISFYPETGLWNIDTKPIGDVAKTILQVTQSLERIYDKHRSNKNIKRKRKRKAL